MGAIVDITQNEVNQVLANEEADSKIKLRRLSHANLIEHVKNIPFKAVAGPKIKSSKFNLPEEQKEFGVSPKKYIQLVTGSEKPINVKGDKIENIRMHSDTLISSAIEKENNEVVTNAEVSVPIVEENSISAPVVEEVSIQTPIVEEKPSVQQEIVQENSQVVASENELVKGEQSIDISEYITKIENETQLVKNVKEKATLAQQEALASDENVSKLSVEVSELEKQEAEAKRRNDELDRQVIAAYETQTMTLANARKEYENLIEEANARKQDNENKVIQFQSKIDNIRERLTTVNESIARKQSILAAMQQSEFMDNIVQFPEMSETEEKVKRIA